jgi:hypothetical protein
MPKVASVRCLVLSAVLVSLAPAALAGQTTPPDGMPEAGPPPNMECAGEPLTGTGPGFSSSRDASEVAAKAAWLEKAKAIYPEASWETALHAGVSCAVQGLYSKCFAQAIPCKPKAE